MLNPYTLILRDPPAPDSDLPPSPYPDEAPPIGDPEPPIPPPNLDLPPDLEPEPVNDPPPPLEAQFTGQRLR